MNFWDQQFSVAGFKYGTAPNAFLRQQANCLTPHSRIVLPGDGEGRNSVWLAEQGHQVLALDSSAVGLQKAQALAQERGVSINTQCCDLADWVPDAGAFDAVVLTFVHLPPTLRALAHGRLAQALRPGGHLLLEAFHPQQLGRSSGGPKQLELLYTAQQLAADFSPALETCLLEEIEVELDEGPGHQGWAWVTRCVGQRR